MNQKRHLLTSQLVDIFFIQNIILLLGYISIVIFFEKQLWYTFCGISLGPEVFFL